MPAIQLVFKGQTWFGLSVSVVAAATAWMVWGIWGGLICFAAFAGGTLWLESRSRRVRGRQARAVYRMTEFLGLLGALGVLMTVATVLN
ncbi:hypothetical protein [Aquabacterium sp.]|uniref:hypothetical protein n=1 Tax=Aquabacterium sp. TaxID=1872578 RepID=UPI002E33A0CC|nr:hypothetical protein [Aquabacterium sp.]HEX5312183.1 hypothetical protein [Aquabacterium sp.]